MILSWPKAQVITMAVTIGLLFAFQWEFAPAAGATDLTCGTTISSNLTLSHDLVCPAGFTGVALIVGADRITIDGAGFKIEAPESPTVIQISSRTGVLIQDVKLVGKDGGDGVRLDSSVGNHILRVNASGSATSPGGNGFFLKFSSDNIIELSTANHRNVGVLLQRTSGGNLIQFNDLANNFQAINGVSSDGQGNQYLDNDVSGSANFAVLLANDNLVKLERNTFGNSAHGIQLTKMKGIVLGNVDLSSIQGTALQLSVVSNSKISDILANGPTVGIKLDSSVGNHILRVNASGSATSPGGNGFFLKFSSDNIIELSTANHRNVGVLLQRASGGNLIQFNDLANNFQAINGVSSDGQGNQYLDNDVSGSANFAVLLANDNLVKLERNTFGNSAHGIQLTKMKGIVLGNVDLSSIQGTALQLSVVSNSKISDILANGPTVGIKLDSSVGNHILRVNASGSATSPGGNGFLLKFSSDNIIKDSTVDNRQIGVAIGRDSSGSTVECSFILNNTIGLQIASGSSGIVISNSHIEGNVQFGVQNSGTDVVKAENNYWGTSGPAGAISRNVDADPFLSEAAGLDVPCGRNKPPTADAGSPQTVMVGENAQLDRGSSDDSEGDPITFLWSFISKPAGSLTVLTGAATVGPSFQPDEPGEYILELIVNDRQENSIPSQVTVTAITRAQATQLVIDDLQVIVNGISGTPLADKTEDVIAKLEGAISEFGKSPPDRQAALGNIEGSVGDLEAAVSSGLLDPVEGNQLMDKLTAIGLCVAANAVDQAVAAGGDPIVIAEAQQYLTEGDALRSSGAYKDAVSKYKDGLAKAESTP